MNHLTVFTSSRDFFRRVDCTLLSRSLGDSRALSNNSATLHRGGIKLTPSESSRTLVSFPSALGVRRPTWKKFDTFLITVRITVRLLIEAFDTRCRPTRALAFRNVLPKADVNCRQFDVRRFFVSAKTPHRLIYDRFHTPRAILRISCERQILAPSRENNERPWRCWRKPRTRIVSLFLSLSFLRRRMINGIKYTTGTRPRVRGPFRKRPK